MNSLYYGDNLDILRKKIEDPSVDLCYINHRSIQNGTITRFTTMWVAKMSTSPNLHRYLDVG